MMPKRQIDGVEFDRHEITNIWQKTNEERISIEDRIGGSGNGSSVEEEGETINNTLAYY